MSHGPPTGSSAPIHPGSGMRSGRTVFYRVAALTVTAQLPWQGGHLGGALPQGSPPSGDSFKSVQDGWGGDETEPSSNNGAGYGTKTRCGRIARKGQDNRKVSRQEIQGPGLGRP